MSAASIKAFHDTWGSSDYPPDPLDAEALASAEAKLEAELPQPYKLAVLQAELLWPATQILGFTRPGASRALGTMMCFGRQ